MADKKKKDRVFGILATIFAHSLLLLCLIFWGFITPLPLPEEIGVEIDVMGGGGGGSSSSVNNNSAQDESVENPSNNAENYATQNSQESVNMNTNNNSNSTPVPDQRVTDFWNSSNSGQGNGDGTGNGDGSGTGDGTGNGSGTGSGNGPGDGVGYSLHDRTSKSIPVPSYTEDAQGKVVVAIWVDKNGNVVKAIPGVTGTTTSNKALWQKSQQAALRAKFSVSANAPPEQKGTITYNFIKFN